MIRSMRRMQQRIRGTLGLWSPFGWRSVYFVLLAGLISIISFLDVPPGQAQPQPAKLNSAYDLIAAVNQLRASNGLSAYQVNPALMAAAQAHSNYQASIGSVTHSGSGGTRPNDRAAAAGYGSGAAISVSENIAGGMNMTYQSAFQMWQGDSLHLNTMLGAAYQDVGAGVATAGGMTFFTLDVGYVTGSASSSSSGSGPAPSDSAEGSTAVGSYPVQVAKPGPDGSIVHEVQPGQSLWSIAATYKIELSDLLALNGFTNNTFIYPGDKILIKTAEVAPDDTEQAPPVSETARAPSTPARTPAPQATVATRDEIGTATPTPTLEPGQIAATSPGANPLLLVIAVLVIGGTALIVVGKLLSRGG